MVYKKVNYIVSPLFQAVFYLSAAGAMEIKGGILINFQKMPHNIIIVEGLHCSDYNYDSMP